MFIYYQNVLNIHFFHLFGLGNQKAYLMTNCGFAFVVKYASHKPSSMCIKHSSLSESSAQLAVDEEASLFVGAASESDAVV